MISGFLNLKEFGSFCATGLPSCKLTACHGTSLYFLANTIKMLDFPGAMLVYKSATFALKRIHPKEHNKRLEPWWLSCFLKIFHGILRCFHGHVLDVLSKLKGFRLIDLLKKWLRTSKTFCPQWWFTMVVRKQNISLNKSKYNLFHTRFLGTFWEDSPDPFFHVNSDMVGRLVSCQYLIHLIQNLSFFENAWDMLRYDKKNGIRKQAANPQHTSLLSTSPDQKKCLFGATHLDVPLEVRIKG